ncbi:TPA: hypothetical protein ACPYV0_003036 [Citrobacter amalonaticus]
MDTLIGISSLVVSIVAAYYAKKAFDSSNKATFPKKNARKNKIEIRNFSKEGREFETFIANNVHARVYINVCFNANEIEVLDSTGGKSFFIWQECFEPLNDGETPSLHKCSGFNVSLIEPQDADAWLTWNRGNYDLTGYFSIKGYGGPHQGSMGAVLRAEKIS